MKWWYYTLLLTQKWSFIFCEREILLLGFADICVITWHTITSLCFVFDVAIIVLVGDGDVMFCCLCCSILRNMFTAECGRFPPSTYCQISALCFLNRLHHMESNQLAKKIFCDLVELDQQGFNTWVTDALKLVHDLRLDVTNEKNIFSLNCKRAVQNKFITTWSTHLQNTELYPRLRTYRTIKHVFTMEPYLYLVKKTRYR